MGRNDLIMALVLRCPAENRLVVFLAFDPYGLAPAQLISQQILTEQLAHDLLPNLEAFRPAVQDMLAMDVENRRRYRELRRSLPWRTRLIEFWLDWVLAAVIAGLIALAMGWCDYSRA